MRESSTTCPPRAARARASDEHAEPLAGRRAAMRDGAEIDAQPSRCEHRTGRLSGWGPDVVKVRIRAHLAKLLEPLPVGRCALKGHGPARHRRRTDRRITPGRTRRPPGYAAPTSP